MRDQLIRHVKHLFEKIPSSHDMQQEILQNSLDRYDDLISQGKSPEAAYQLAISGLGDLQELSVPTARKRSVWPILLVIGLILGLILLLWLIRKGPAEDPIPTSPTSSTAPSDPTVPTDPTNPTDPTIPSTTSYTISCANTLSLSFLMDPLPTKAAGGSIVTLKTHALTDVDLVLYVNDEIITYQTTVEQGDQVYWLFSFIMPECNVTIQFRTVAFELTPEMRYQQAEALAEEGKLGEAAIAFSKLGDFLDARERCLALWAQVRPTLTIDSNHILVGIRNDGTLITIPDADYDVVELQSWRNLCSVTASETHVLALTANGTVLAAGDNTYGQCNVSDWENIVQIIAGKYFSIGLKADGTVEYVGIIKSLYKVEDWTDIVMLQATDDHVVGLHSDGTVVAVGDNSYGQCDVADLRNVIHIHVGHLRTTLLCADGTIVNRGYHDSNSVDIGRVPGLVEYYRFLNCYFGILYDGQIVYLKEPMDPSLECLDIQYWQNTVSFFIYRGVLCGLQADGTIIKLCIHSESTCPEIPWTDMMIP